MCGALQIRLLSDKFTYRWLEMGINFRSKAFKLPYGDQGLFVKRSIFEKLGGFREMPVCEDLDFVYRLRRKYGEIAILNGRISSSVRTRETVASFEPHSGINYYYIHI